MNKVVFAPASEKQHLFLNDEETDVILYGGGAGAGKALRHGEKVLTPAGFINIEDIRVGDEVVTPKGTLEKVTHVWPQGIVPILKVVFQDGRTVETCANHLWRISLASNKDAHCKMELVVDTGWIKRKLITERGAEELEQNVIYIPTVSPALSVEEFPALRIIDVLDEGVKDYATCIAITGEDKLFVTTNYIVTHNSYCALLKQLVGVEDPHFRAVFIRNTRPQLISAGALVDESKGIYNHFKPKFRSDILQYTFKSGAQISFKAINSKADLDGYDGTQYTRIIFDEAQNQFGEESIVYLLSRLRSKSKLKHQLIMTANPRSDSFLKSWVEYCLDEDGVPKSGTEHRIRWFIRVNNKQIWADSKEELLDKYPDSKPLSFRFIPATVIDNPILLKNQPTYLANLKALRRIDQLRLLHGSWTAREEAAGYFKREWCELVDAPPINPISRVRAWDLASTIPSDTNPDPDYTAGVKMSRDKYGTYYIEDVVRFRKRSGEVLEEIIAQASYDGRESTPVAVPRDPGQAGKGWTSYLLRSLSEHGIFAKSVDSTTTGKLTRFLPLATLAESGNLKVVKGDWNEEFFAELEAFTGKRGKIHDDQVDAAADAFKVLARELHLPVFSLPDLSRPSGLVERPNFSSESLDRL